jgi:hydrogenase expression/formation protein HypC
MCLAIPGKITSLQGQQATVQYPHESRQVLVAGIPVKEGDYVLVQMGIIIQVISPSDAKLSLDAWK